MDTVKFIWLCSFFFTFVTSFLLLFAFWRNRLIRLAGMYALLPGINATILNGVLIWFNNRHTIFISIIIEILLLIPFLYFFRHLYKVSFIIPLMLLSLDVFHLIWLAISRVLNPSSTLGLFGSYLFYFYFIVPFTVLLFCVLTRNYRLDMAQKVNI